MQLRRLAVLIGFVIGLFSWCPAAAARSKGEIWDDQARQQRIAAAWEAGDEASVLRIFDEKPDARAYGSNRECYWKLAVTLEHAGRYAAARDFYVRVADGSGDPDALWGLWRCVLAMGPGKAAAQARALAKERPMLAIVLEALLAGPSDAAALGRRFDAGVSLADQKDDRLAGAALRLLRGDLAMQRGDGEAALQSYVYVSYDHKVAAVYVREAAMFGSLDRWGDAQYDMGKMAKLEGYDAFVSPPAESLAAQVRAGIAAWQQRESTRDSLAREAAYAAAPPPAGLDWGNALKAAMPNAPIEDDGYLQWETDRWTIRWNPEQEILFARFADDGANRRSQDPREVMFSRRLGADSLRVCWQPERQRYVVKDHDHEPGYPFRVMLYANGDLFFGANQFAGRGLYLSAGQPPYEGVCYFGRAPGVAQRVVRVLEQSEGEGEGAMQSLHVLLADSAEFAGTGVIENGVLIPAATGRIRYPGVGTFFGQFKDGTPDHGMLQDATGRLFVIHDHRLALNYEPGLRRGDRLVLQGDILKGDPEMLRLPSGVLEFLDGTTGLLMTFDPESGRFDERYDEDRLRLYQLDVKYARLDQEREQRGAEIQARVDASNKAADEAAARLESVSRSSTSGSAFQFWAPKRNDRCIHCKGAGQIYVGSSVTQDYRYDENNKTMVDSNLHVSGHMEVCHWCNGTGKR